MKFKLRVLLILLVLLSSSLLHAEEGPHVEMFSPEGVVKGVRQVSVRFSEQMVPFGSPALVEPFDISCTEKGSERWADGKNWVYDFERDLPAGIICEFTLKPDTRTLAGKEIQGRKKFFFSTGGPAVRSISPYAGSNSIAEDNAFLIELDSEVSEESVLSNVFFLVEGINERIGVNIISGELKQQISRLRGRKKQGPFIILQSRQRFPNDSAVTLVWGKDILSKSGVPTDAEQRFNYKSRKPFTVEFHCERESPQAGCIPISQMEVSFSAPVSWKQAGKIILRGPKNQALKPEEQAENGDIVVNSVYFKAPFPENTDFMVELPEEINDEGGRKLINKDKFPLKVSTDKYPPLAKFAARFGILELNAQPALPLTVRNIEPEVLARIVKPGSGGIGKIKNILESYTGQILKVDSLKKGNENEIVSWLNRMYMYNDEEDRGSSVFSNQEKSSAKKLSIPKPGGARAFEVIGIQFKESGFYVVEVESAILGSSLLGRPEPVFVPATVLVTNLSVHFKWGRESSIAWVTALDTGRPVNGAMVDVKDCAGKILWKGKTDSNGIADLGRLPVESAVPNCGNGAYGRGLFVTARLAKDMAFVHSGWTNGIEPWRFQLPKEYDSWPIMAHTVFDRSLLRAGETLHMKHFLRRHNMYGVSVPESFSPKTLSIRHSGSDQTYEFPLKWDGNGIAETVWDIPGEAKLGNYQTFFVGDKGSGSSDGFADRYSSSPQFDSGSFRVEEFRVPLMKGIIKPPDGTMVQASQIPVDLAVAYLAGGGAGGAQVRFRSQVQPRRLPEFKGFEGLEFSNGPVKEGLSRRRGFSDYDDSEETDEEKKKLVLKSEELTLDRSGSAKTMISGLAGMRGPAEVLTELEFKDPNGEIQTVSSRIPLWSSKRLVGIRPESWAASKESMKFYVGVVDLKGAPAPDTPVKVDIFEQKNYSHRKRLVGGFYAYEHFTEIKRIDTFCEGKTDRAGLLICEGRSPVSGQAILQASVKDDDGNIDFVHKDIWVAGKNQWWFDVGDSDRIDLLPEKKHYEPGEVARFQVRMPFRDATVLVTIEREGILDKIVKRVSGKSPVLEIPIKGNYGPNIFVSALAVRGRVGGIQPTAMVDLGKPAYKLGITEINVGWKSHELKVDVSTERKVYKVREKARVKVSVRTAYGQVPPAGSEIALAAVDEGLLELMPNNSWEILKAMMGRRGYEIDTATAQMHIVGKRHFGLKALPQGGGGGKQATRELFDTLLLWKGRVKLDSKGEAEVEVPINDSITGFRIVAIATGGASLFGTGYTSVRSTQDLIILSGIAPLVREGDSFRSEFTLRNTTDRIMEVELSGRVKGLPEPLKPIAVSLSPGEARETGWDVTSPFGRTSLDYEIEAKEAGGSMDKLTVRQKVVPAVAVRTFQATITQLDKDLSLTVKRPEDALPGRGGINIGLRSKLSDGLGGVIEYMKLYPYTCLEQRVSRAVALRDESLWKQIVAEMPGYLDSNGLAKYFPSMREGSEVLTSYIISISNEAGLDIPDEVKAKMLSALNRFAEGSLTRWSSMPTADLAIRKVMAIEAVSRAMKFKVELLNSISIEPNLWPTSTAIDWYNILKRHDGIPDREKRLKEAEQILRSRLNFQGTTMGFSTEGTDNLWWLMVSNDTNSVKLILSMLDSEKWKEDMPRMVRGALGRQKRGAWDLTVSNAWGVLALEKFSAAFEKEPVTGITRARLSEKTGSIDWNEGAKKEKDGIAFSWPSTKEELVINHDGSGKPWATVQSLAAIPLKEPFSSGYRIKKSLIPVEQKQKGSWSRGDIVRVKLEVDAQSDMTWVVINDPIPAGAAILGSGLGRDSKIATTGERKTGRVWPAFEERSFESFRSYYEFVPKGVFSVEYTVRLNQSGSFHLPSTRVEALYSPEMFGEIPNGRFEVTH